MEHFSEWFDKIYIENASTMTRTAAYILGDEKTAEDLVQNAFIVLLAKPEVMFYDNPKAWLYITLRNQIGNEFQKKHREFLPLYENSASYTPSDNFEDILPSQLTDSEKAILTLAYQYKYSHDEISKMTGKSVLACRARLYRAIQHCRSILKDEK